MIPGNANLSVRVKALVACALDSRRTPDSPSQRTVATEPCSAPLAPLLRSSSRNPFRAKPRHDGVTAKSRTRSSVRQTPKPSFERPTMKRRPFHSICTIATVILLMSAETSAETLTQFRIGMTPDQDAAQRLQLNECMVKHVQDLLGVPVSLYTPADFNAVIEGLIGGNLDLAYLGPSAYARVFLTNPNAVEPILVRVNPDRSYGFYAVAFSRIDSGINSIEDAKGRTLAFGDPNSTSGYLIPDFFLKKNGTSTKAGEYFGDVVFSGGHPQSIIGVFNGDYDVSFTYTDGEGFWEDGYSSGPLRMAADGGAVDLSEMKEIWRSEYMVEGPIVIRKDLPERVKVEITGLLASLGFMDPQCTYNFLGGESLGLKPVKHESYTSIIEMRQQAR
jgi:phosphonate transport system substrate-binding protein